ncbi:MAG: hypothetical protein WD079_00815, partial [Phycisphaeraceae bacterium]
MTTPRRWMMLSMIFAALTLAGCGAAADDHADQAGHAQGPHHDHDHDAHNDDHADHGHQHDAPHGGALVAIGDHFAHLEAVLDPETGQLTLYILDGDVQRGVRVAHEQLQLTIHEVDGESATFDLTLEPVASGLTGETVGDTSQFQATDDRLATAEQFTAELHSLTVRGQTIEALAIHYPDGN